MDIQRLRNLTTHRLHTKMSHVYQDLEYITGYEGIMTHMIPNVLRAVDPWLKKKVTEPRFWDGEYDTTHVGVYPLEPMTEDEKASFCKAYAKLPNPLDDHKTIAVLIEEGKNKYDPNY